LVRDIGGGKTMVFFQARTQRGKKIKRGKGWKSGGNRNKGGGEEAVSLTRGYKKDQRYVPGKHGQGQEQSYGKWVSGKLAAMPRTGKTQTRKGKKKPLVP